MAMDSIASTKLLSKRRNKWSLKYDIFVVSYLLSAATHVNKVIKCVAHSECKTNNHHTEQMRLQFNAFPFAERENKKKTEKHLNANSTTMMMTIRKVYKHLKMKEKIILSARNAQHLWNIQSARLPWCRYYWSGNFFPFAVWYFSVFMIFFRSLCNKEKPFAKWQLYAILTCFLLLIISIFSIGERA